MDAQQLQHILTSGEDSKHQFKREISRLDSLAAELAVPNSLNKPYMDLQGRVWVKNGADKRHVTSP